MSKKPVRLGDLSYYKPGLMRRKLEQRLDPLSSALKIDGSVKTGTINGSKSQFRFRAIDPMPLNACFNR
jgi:hypothetical protein